MKQRPRLVDSEEELKNAIREKALHNDLLGLGMLLGGYLYAAMKYTTKLEERIKKLEARQAGAADGREKRL